MIALDEILRWLGIIVSLVAGIGAIKVIVKDITTKHDQKQKWDSYDAQIKEVNEKIDTSISQLNKNIEDQSTETTAKLQQMQAEQCMLTYCMMATLDGLKQLGCNGKVTEARDKLDKFMNKQAHGVDQ